MKVTSASVDVPAALAQAQAGQPLSAADTKRVFDAIFTGRGTSDVRARLLDASGRKVLENDDRPDDWNFHIAQRLAPGDGDAVLDGGHGALTNAGVTGTPRGARR